MRSFFVKAVLFFVIVGFSFSFATDSFAKPKSLKAVPKKVLISVDQVPENLVSLVVPLTFDANVVNILSAESNSKDSLVVFSQNGVGIVQTTGNLPSMFNLSVTFSGLKRGKTSISTGEIVDKLGGAPIEGAVARVKVKKIKVK